MPTYRPEAIEARWQRYWEENKTFKAVEKPGTPKFYILDMFPYPSGAGLHVGHPEGYTATDILARYKRMRGFNVLHPMGWDAFGLPAEQYAIETGTHPRDTTKQNIDTFRRQIKMLGFSYDWDREVDTTDPAYFRWTQWIFLQLFDTWYDPELKRGRPISELPIPPEVLAKGEAGARAYRDSKRLAYQAEVAVNWCPALGTVLANEEVEDGKSERGGHPVERRPMRQWLLRITAYADRLLSDLNLVQWPDSIRKMQADWIGRSEGAEVDFRVAASKGGGETGVKIRIFTTRPDTLFGATYMVLAPEHPLLDRVTTPDRAASVKTYREQARRKSDLERTELSRRKSGVFTGGYAINPVNEEIIPIWTADYVLASYGTGAIMAVPAHDDRDFEFARQYGLSMRAVVQPPNEWLEKTHVYSVISTMGTEGSAKPPELRFNNPSSAAETLIDTDFVIMRAATKAAERMGKNPLKLTTFLYRNNLALFEEAFLGEGQAINSAAFEGLTTSEFKKRITEWLEENGKGGLRVNYKLRDWLFSRQRYWGEPFPILHEVDAQGQPTGNLRALDEAELPLRLPEMSDYKPTGKPEPPLEKAGDWLWVERDGKRYKRETNTMPQWAGSCWYYLRYLDPMNESCFCDPKKERYWMPVELYVGGAEHAVLHLLYSRFWHKVLFDRGHVHTPEPFTKLVNQGMILGEMEFTAWKEGDAWVLPPADEQSAGSRITRVKLAEDQVEKQGDGFVVKGSANIKVDARSYKMSKSRGNVINPDEVVKKYGSDSMRLYEMFMGPLEATKPWSMRGVEGVSRFLGRVWRLVIDDRSEEMKLSQAVQDIPADRETLRLLHGTIKKVTEDLDGMRFNTAIAAMMELTNHLTPMDARPQSVLRPFMLILAPFAPHLAEELWHALGGKDTLAYEPWPAYDESLTREEQIEVPVQINGKVRGKIIVAPNIEAQALEQLALSEEKVRALLQGKTVRKVIVVPRKLVNIVAG